MMESDYADTWSASTSTLATPVDAEPVAATEPASPPRRSGAGRRVAAATRWFLVVPFVVLTPVALILWAAVPRITSPALVAEQAVELGLTGAVREMMVDDFASELADRQDGPVAEGTMREVFDRSLSQEWFDAQLMGIAVELDRWLAGTGADMPDLVIDLVPVKTALAADPEAMQLVSNFLECSGPGCAPGEQSATIALGSVPDQAALLAFEEDSKEAADLVEARGLLQRTRRAGLFVPLVILLEFALLVLLARRHARLRFAGAVVLIVGVLTFLVALLGPGWLGGIAADAVPPDIPLAAPDVAALVSWTVEPARSLAVWLLAAGAAAVAGSFAWDALSRRVPA